MKCWETNMTDLLPFLQIIIFSLSNCHICDDQVVIFAAKWSFWRTLRLDEKYLYLHLIPFTNCICISSRQEEGLWDGRVKGARGEGGRGGYHRNSLCNGLITYSSSGSCFCKRPSYKINMKKWYYYHNKYYIHHYKSNKACAGMCVCGIRASVGPRDMTIWGRVR